MSESARISCSYREGTQRLVNSPDDLLCNVAVVDIDSFEVEDGKITWDDFKAATVRVAVLQVFMISNYALYYSRRSAEARSPRSS